MSTVLPTSCSLAAVASGKFRCVAIDAFGQNELRLKRLGICEGRSIELLGQGDPMILRIGDSRIGLSRQLASHVIVEPLIDSFVSSGIPDSALA